MDDINKNGVPFNGEQDNRASEVTGEVAAVPCPQCARSEEQLLYMKADFENYRRNVSRDRALWSQNAQSVLMLDLLPIVDNFERALKDLALVQNASEPESARLKGIELIYRELITFLNRNGVAEMASLVQFDPSKQEAIARIEMAGKEAGAIVDVVQKGYLYKESVLRPAKVVVAK
ncbi:MAG: Protein GrpE [candidate division TM6 bacterium GW2011_GWF2_43_87]|nr:MAG: Protein GrpE [candidate division TM6 bacterium GW2011_GWF2_43_87]